VTLKPLVLEATRSHSNSAKAFLFEIIPLLIESMAKKIKTKSNQNLGCHKKLLWLKLHLKYIVMSFIFSHRLMTFFYLTSIDFIQCTSCFNHLIKWEVPPNHLNLEPFIWKKSQPKLCWSNIIELCPNFEMFHPNHPKGTPLCIMIYWIVSFIFSWFVYFCNSKDKNFKELVYGGFLESFVGSLLIFHNPSYRHLWTIPKTFPNITTSIFPNN
jgi:hypothetical protein